MPSSSCIAFTKGIWGGGGGGGGGGGVPKFEFQWGQFTTLKLECIKKMF